MTVRTRWLAWIALLAVGAAASVSFEDPDGGKVVQAVESRPRLQAATPADRAPRGDVVGRVRLERLNDRGGAAVDAADLFVARSWKPEPNAGAPERPAAPPLPFTYLGRLHSAGSDTAYVAMGERNLAVKAGDLIQDTYRVERVAGNAVTFRHLPTGDRQTLAIGGSP